MFQPVLIVIGSNIKKNRNKQGNARLGVLGVQDSNNAITRFPPKPQPDEGMEQAKPKNAFSDADKALNKHGTNNVLSHGERAKHGQESEEEAPAGPYRP